MGAFNNHVDRRRGEGVSQMSMIVHAREGGGLVNVHVDKILGQMYNFFAPKWIVSFTHENCYKAQDNQSFAYKVVLQYIRKFMEGRIIFLMQKYLNMADLKGVGAGHENPRGQR